MSAQELTGANTTPDQFPMWLYHKDAGSRLFQSQQDLINAGHGWYDSPEKVAKAQGKGHPDQDAANGAPVLTNVDAGTARAAEAKKNKER